MEEIVVIARFEAQPHKVEGIMSLLRPLMEQTRQEPGCLHYDLYRSTENYHKFVLHERWASEDALNAHLEMPHVQELFERAPAILAGPVEMVRLRELAPV